MFPGKQKKLPPVLPGFQGVSRFWDQRNKISAAKILPGEYYVTIYDELISTVLGSCVSACIRDRISGVGGMNHFMLPLSDDGQWAGSSHITGVATRYGNFAMEHMINDILSHGGHRGNLEVKLFGGAQIISSMGDIGRRNIEFVFSYLETEGIQIVTHDVGDIYPRKVLYYPSSGRVRMKKLKDLHNDTVVKREQNYQHQIEQEPIAGEIELF
ncbi:MAG: chemoreceptor glutamine deamidase CheD [Gammaproteobacteria bacterium]|nr:chemoreceptor glutamine deamidase CheD [Gammaproteobacteria bacterium]